VLEFHPHKEAELAKAMKSSSIDTIMLIPPAHQDKVRLTLEMRDAAMKAEIPKVLFLSAAGCDLAERDKQPRLREFIDLEAKIMETKGMTETNTGHSPCIIRAGFYSENLLLYNRQSQSDGKLPLPIGTNHKFAPVALGDVALLAAHILTSEGPQGFADNVRGQLIPLTGPLLTSGEELATAAKDGAGLNLHFVDISEKDAKDILDTQSDLDESEKEFLLEYYSLVREGKTNYVSTVAFTAVTGQHAQEPTEFFKIYDAEFKTTSKRRKTSK